MIPNVVWLRIGLCFGLLGSLVVGQLPAARAQSDPAGFTTVINAPPTIIGRDDSIGSNTQLNVFDAEDVSTEVGSGFNAGVPFPFGSSTNVELNLFDGRVNFDFTANSGSTTNILGGSLGSFAEANSGSVVNISGGLVSAQLNANNGSEVNISGGSVGVAMDANSGSVVNISGGSIGRQFEAFAGSEVNVSGGTFGFNFDALPGSNVTFTGGEFLLNGEPPANPASVTLSGTDVLTGTLEDGSVFIFSAEGGDELSGVTLQSGTLPENNVLPLVVFDDSGRTIGGLRSGQSLTLLEGGSVADHFSAVNATLDMQGGTINGNLQLVDSAADISGGTLSAVDAYTGSTLNISGDAFIGGPSSAISGSEVNISGGTLTSLFSAAGSVVNVSGGSIRDSLTAGDGSTVVVSGGELGTFDARLGSSVEITGGRLQRFSGFGEVTISGGTFGTFFNPGTGNDVTIRGGEFLLNGIAPANLDAVTLNGNDVLSGTLEDGSVFIFFGGLIDVAFETVPLSAIDLTPIVVDDALDLAPAGLRAGQSLTLQGTGVLPDNFAVVDATLTIDGGTVGSNAVGGRLEVVNSTIDVSGGEILQTALLDSTLNIEDGTVGNLSALAETTVNQSGGIVQGSLLGENSIFNLSGGTFGLGDPRYRAAILAEAGSTLNLFVSEASIDGVAIDLTSGETLEITERGFDVVLSGLLSDGSEFGFLLQPVPFIPAIGGDAFAPGSTITVTLVSPVLLGDVNQDEVVNFEDIPSFIEVLQAGIFLPEADVNQDGVVDFGDIPRFIAILQDM